MYQLFKEFISTIIVNLIKINENSTYRRIKQRGLLEVGKHTYGQPIIDIYRNSERKVIIGKYCSISKEVRIITGGIHPTNWISNFPIRDNLNVDIPYDGTPTSNGDIIIGNDVWIGTGATILSGVKIGNGAVVAACALVSKDVPPYTIVGGVPAKEIRKRFNEDQIDFLQKINWWDWDEEKIRENVHLLSSPNIDKFIHKLKNDIA
jgi:acetyltransferase-like isoleucine patch superfamily enzyme